MKIKKIIRSNRKSIALQVCSDTSVIIRAPFHATDKHIEQVILKHHQWLIKKQKEILLRQLKFPVKEFTERESFFFMGKEYELHLVEEQREPLTINNHYFLLRKNSVNPREIFVSWYKKMARITLSERVAMFGGQFGFSYHKISITNAQKQWGSCSHVGNLNFSWRLIMAPLSVIDYVIIHEMVHLDTKNHSTYFWKRVKGYLPEYKTHREWLRKNSHLLRL